MTPEQCIKHIILNLHANFLAKEPLALTAENIDDLYLDAEENDDGNLQDAVSEVRCSGEETGLDCDYSRHYESRAVARKAPNGRWVGWTEWHGGGKHSEPDAIPWMKDAYFVDCAEEEKLVKVRAFTRHEASF